MRDLTYVIHVECNWFFFSYIHFVVVTGYTVAVGAGPPPGPRGARGGAREAFVLGYRCYQPRFLILFLTSECLPEALPQPFFSTERGRQSARKQTKTR